MRISYFIFAILIAYVYGERCRVTDISDCDHEECDSHSHVVCYVQHPGDQLGFCTCAYGRDPAKPTAPNVTNCSPTVACVHSTECSSDKFPFCRSEFTHCLNAFCRCLPGVTLGSLPVGK